MSRKLVATLGLAVVLLIALGASAACGGSSDEPSGGMDPNMDMDTPMDTPMANNTPMATEEAEVVIDLKAQQLRYVPDTLEIPAGKIVMIRFENLDAGVEHDFQVDGLEVEVMSMSGGMPAEGQESMSGLAAHTRTGGETATITFRTEQTGTFDMYCTIAGHREAGMEGKVTVS